MDIFLLRPHCLRYILRLAPSYADRRGEDADRRPPCRG